MKGFKTLAVGVAVATVPAALNYLGGVDWTSIGISPAMGGLLGSLIIGLRAVTTTAIGQK